MTDAPTTAPPDDRADRTPFDAVLVVSFGGPEGPDDVMPFLENVLRGRNVPRERMEAVAEHYHHFGGISPINAQNRALIAALEAELADRGPHLPVYFGNRNWHPLLPDTLARMRDDGIRRAVAVFTSAYSSYSGCRQYRENIVAAQEAVGADAPRVEKVRAFFNHPGFVTALVDRLEEAAARLTRARAEVPVLFSAHSIPSAMAAGCRYETQLAETARLVATRAGFPTWRLVYQSRSGPPTQPWLEPDVCDVVRQIGRDRPGGEVIVHPIGFLSDHMEVLYDLDEEAQAVAAEVGVTLHRAGTPGTHPVLVTMIRDLIAERVEGRPDRPAVGVLPASHDVCPVGCCAYEPRRPAATGS